MCLGLGGGQSTPAPVYQSPAPAPAPVTAEAVELKEEDDLVTDTEQNKQSSKDALRIDRTNTLGTAISYFKIIRSQLCKNYQEISAY